MSDEKRLITLDEGDQARLMRAADFIEQKGGNVEFARGVRSLADRYEDGIDEATVIGSYLCSGCHDKLRAAFEGTTSEAAV